MSHETAQSAEPADLRCPACWHALPASADPGWVRCGACGRVVDRQRAAIALQYAQQAAAASDYAAYTERVAAGWRRVADGWQAAAVRAAHEAAGSTAPADPPTAAPIPGSLPAQQLRREVPTAVLLQGTGAVLVLAAVVVVSAVAWTVLSAVGQVVLLAAVVVVLGTLTVATRTRVPTTSIVLAALTAAVYVVVAITVPALQPQLSTRWYPFAAAVLGAALLLLAGRLGSIALWQHAGVAALPLAALLLPPAVLDLIGPAQWSLAALLLAAQAMALSALAVRQRGTDVETGTTAVWAGISLTVATAAATTLAVVLTAIRIADSSLTKRLWLAAAVLGLVGLLVVLGRLATVAGRSPNPLNISAAALVPLPAAVAFVPVAYPSWPIALVPAAVLWIELLAGAWAWRAWRTAPSRRSVVLGWMWGAVAAAVVWGAIAGAALIGERTAGEWLWLAPHAVGLVLGAAAIGTGLAARNMLLTAGGTAFAVVVWGSWFAGGYLPSEVEVLALPVALLLLAVGTAAAARWPDAPARRLPWRAGAVLAGGIPTCAVAAAGYADSSELQAPRIALLVVLAMVAMWLDRHIRSALTLVVATGTVEAAALAFVALGQAQVDVVEAYAVVAAAATGLTLLAAWREQYVTGRAAGTVTAAVLLAPSLVVAFLDPQFVAAWAGARAVTVLAILVVTAVAAWRRTREISAAAGSTAIALLAWWYVFWLGDSSWASVPEAWSVPLAAALTGVLALGTAAAGGGDRRLLLLPAGVALLISSAVSLVWTAGRPEHAATLRAVVVVTAWWVLVWLARSHSHVFAGCTAVAVFLTWSQGLSLAVWNLPPAPFELFTWSAAAALALGTGLIVRRRGMTPTSLIWLAPSLTLVLLPTALAAWSEGTVGWRVWFVLAAGTIALALGVMRKWAGAVWPALLALACVVVPVITRLASDAPAWVPLAIAGTALLALGARFESLRRQGRSAAHWAATLD